MEDLWVKGDGGCGFLKPRMDTNRREFLDWFVLAF